MRTGNIDVIGVGGHKESGKDYFASYVKNILEARGQEVSVIGMSDPLRDALYIIDPAVFVPRGWQGYSGGFYVPISQLRTWLEDEDEYTILKTIPDVREFLQKLGTNVVRDMIDKNAWVYIALRKIEENRKRGIVTIITGIRFENELGITSSHYTNSVSVYIENPGRENQDDHVSENSVSSQDFDVVLKNDKTENFNLAVHAWLSGANVR